MIRYLSDYEGRDELDAAVWFPLKEPPDTPYLKLKIQVVGREPRFVHSDRIRTRSVRVFGSRLELTVVSKRRRR